MQGAAMNRTLACLLTIAFMGRALPAAAVTDCSKAKTNIDRLLCSNDRLSLADQRMALAFRDAFNRTADREALIEEQQAWKRDVRDACNDVPCLLEAYQRRTSELETY
jgi:uncharacterized protein